MSRQLDTAFWQRYREYLSTVTCNETRNDRISYAKKYYRILYTGNASQLLTLSNDKRIHAMKSISSLSKYLGSYNIWKQIIERYQLKWSNENSLESFNDIWNNKINYSSMLSWLKKTYVKLPEAYGNVLLYCTLTGLRPDEACTSIELIHNDFDNYVNKEKMILEHFRYPEVFFRRTKKAYVSVVTEEIIEIAKNSGPYSYDSIRRILRRHEMQMRMSYCRKIFATYLRMNGVESEIIDMLQGRTPKSIFARHYFKPDINNDKIRLLLNSLMKIIL